MTLFLKMLKLIVCKFESILLSNITPCQCFSLITCTAHINGQHIHCLIFISLTGTIFPRTLINAPSAVLQKNYVDATARNIDVSFFVLARINSKKLLRKFYYVASECGNLISYNLNEKYFAKQKINYIGFNI